MLSFIAGDPSPASAGAGGRTKGIPPLSNICHAKRIRAYVPDASAFLYSNLVLRMLPELFGTFT